MPAAKIRAARIPCTAPVRLKFEIDVIDWAEMLMVTCRSNHDASDAIARHPVISRRSRFDGSSLVAKTALFCDKRGLHRPAE
jgi:hypothetical protein